MRVNFLLDTGFERAQHQPQFQADVQITVREIQVAFHPTALEREQVALPLVIDVELLRQIFRQGFCRFTGVGFVREWAR